jgi:hypothetical protein
LKGETVTDNLENANADPSKNGPHLLTGAIELTPEARSILTKQVNRRIVWGYKATKAVFQGLSLLPLIISIFFLVVGYDLILRSWQGALVVTIAVGLPAFVSFWLFRWASRI